MQKILIIKTGAAGDIVRTTILLNILKGEITWVTKARYADILSDKNQISRIVTIDIAAETLKGELYDLTISLEENRQCAFLASRVKTSRLVGIYLNNDKIAYTKDAAGWYDMGLISQYDSAYANRLKIENTFSFQFLLMKMLGLAFKGESYQIYKNDAIKPVKGKIGIETRVGPRWPNKGWGHYKALKQKLEHANYSVVLFEEKEKIRDYLDEIASCSIIISGDTLAMHVAMAYNIPSVAIFNCTSPAEIHDYGILKKAISPLLKNNFYSTDFSQQVIDSVPLIEVCELIEQII